MAEMTEVSEKTNMYVYYGQRYTRLMSPTTCGNVPQTMSVIKSENRSQKRQVKRSSSYSSEASETRKGAGKLWKHLWNCSSSTWYLEASELGSGMNTVKPPPWAPLGPFLWWFPLVSGCCRSFLSLPYVFGCPGGNTLNFIKTCDNLIRR